MQSNKSRRQRVFAVKRKSVLAVSTLFVLTIVTFGRYGASDASALQFGKKTQSCVRDDRLALRWSEGKIIKHLIDNPNRASFADLFSLGGFRSGVEVGVADGRFSEHFLRVNKDTSLSWLMIEPFPNQNLKSRFAIDDHGTADFTVGTWARDGVGLHAHLSFVRELSTDLRLIRDIADNSLDFVYLDGAHDYKNVLAELPLFYKKIRSGGVLAGHDYCNYGESPARCNGCDGVPACGTYTEYGIAHGKPSARVANQAGVVRAVHEWLTKEQPSLRLHHTTENFTRASLAEFGMDYDLVITGTRNPSWFVIKR